MTFWNGLNIVFIIQYIHDFCGFANILLHISLKMGNKVKNFWVQRIIILNNFYLKLKNIILFLTRGLFLIFLFVFFKWSYLQRCFDVAQRCENRRWKKQHCFDVVQYCSNQRWKRQRWFNVAQRCKLQRWHLQYCFNAELTLWDVATSYQPKSNVGTSWNMKSHLKFI